MKLGDVERHLRGHNCEILRQGARHTMWWNPATGETKPCHDVKKSTIGLSGASAGDSVCRLRDVP